MSEAGMRLSVEESEIGITLWIFVLISGKDFTFTFSLTKSTIYRIF